MIIDAIVIVFFQGRPPVLIICVLISILTGVSILTAVSILTVVYPKVVLPVVFLTALYILTVISTLSDSSTVVYILTMVSSLSDSSQQHSPHFLFSCFFHQCLFCCMSKNLCIQYVNILGRNDLITALIKLTHYLPERKAIAASLQLREANDSFGKGFHLLKAQVLKAHVLNRLMTGRK